MAQTITTGALNVKVTNAEGAPVAGARVNALHVPSGTSYTGTTMASGRAALPSMRVGGPYRITVAAIGFESQTRENIYVALGVAEDETFKLSPTVVTLEEVTVTATGETIFSSHRTGAATTIPREALATLPTVTGRLEDFTRLTPQVRGSSFAGQEPKLNNITVDGSYFNNSFGVSADKPGDRTGVAPISIAAIEQVQINIAPYDVRQGHFVGANVNTVTRSGGNEFFGSLAYGWRNEGLTGTTAGPLLLPVSIGTFNFSRFGGYVGGPVIKNKLFFFASYEKDKNREPGTTWRANAGGETVEGSVTRVLKSDLDALHDYMLQNFDLELGPYEGYFSEIPATRFIGKLDYNMNERNKVSLRFNYLDSFTDQLISNSAGFGLVPAGGTRRTGSNGLTFQSSNYQIQENRRGIVGEWNSTIKDNIHNNLIIGYDNSDESRATGKSPFDATQSSTWFPYVEILKDGLNYTGVGTEPFSPQNELRYSSLQFQNNLTIYGDKHDWTFGITAERFKSYNVFWGGNGGANSVYTYNSLDDFYADLNGYLANPSRTTSGVPLRKFGVVWSNIPDQEKPLQEIKAYYMGAYAQDEWRPTRNLKLTMGLRVDMPVFSQGNLLNNQEAANFTFKNQKGELVHYTTNSLPNWNPTFSPRFGFNWDVTGERTTQVRGGTGLLSGPPAYVWISNQLGANGMLTGSVTYENIPANCSPTSATLPCRPFNPDPNFYKPTNVTGAPASSYELNFTDPGFKYPQVWRSNLAVDQRLPWGLVATGEFIYNRTLNGIRWVNINLPNPQSKFTGVDERPRWLPASTCSTASGGSGNCTRIYNKVTFAYLLENESSGRAWNLGGSLERRFEGGLFAKVAYDYGEAKNLFDPSSTASSGYNSNRISGNPNNPGLGFSFNSPGHRFFATVSFSRDLLKFGRTTISAFYNAQTNGNTSYAFSGDLNGDINTANDLIYIPRDKSEMNFQTFTRSASGSVPARTFSITEQQDAFENYILQDKYLSSHRGEYAQRNAVFFPMLKRLDLSIAQDLHALIGGARNSLEFRADFLNFSNFINNKWGSSTRMVTNAPLTVPSSAGSVLGCASGPANGVSGAADACGRVQYRLFSDIVDGQYKLLGEEGLNRTFVQTSTINDVWRLQFMLRYLFN
jgi:hypothetical protein